MKKLFLFPVIGIALFAGCAGNNGSTTGTATKDTTLQYFGDTITSDGAIASTELTKQLENLTKVDSPKNVFIAGISRDIFVVYLKGINLPMPIEMPRLRVSRWMLTFDFSSD